MRLRTRVFLLLAGPVVLGGAAVLWWTETELASRLEAAALEALVRQGRLAAAVVGDRAFSDSLADELGERTGLRVTLLAPDGRVAGDSEVPAGRLAEVESHADRPEVRSALAGEPGAARRASATVARSLLYVAVPHARGALRLARPTAEVDAIRVRTRRFVLAGSAAGLVAAFLVASGVIGLVGRPMRRVRDAVAAIGRGDLSRRVAAGGQEEVRSLADAVNAMADAVQRRVQSLRAEKDDLDALFETLEDGLAVLDPEGIVVRANRAFRIAVGRDDVVGLRFGTLVRAPELARAVEVGLSGRVAGEESTLGERTVFATVHPHRGGALVVLRDLTRLRRLEGVRRDFVANVSHELKTPLTSVMGFAEAVAEGDLPREDAVAFGRKILSNARRMRQLVDDLLDLARMESGSWTPVVETVAVPAMARSVWESLQPGPERKGVVLELESGPASMVRADRDALRQILRNLFDNALRYAPEGSTVRVGLRPVGDMLRTEVTDSGPGIPSAHVSRVFERFYRADPARSRAEGGTGLGLSIVKHLVTGHGGRVGVESELGRGTTVWFTLPAAAAPALGEASDDRTA